MCTVVKRIRLTKPDRICMVLVERNCTAQSRGVLTLACLFTAAFLLRLVPSTFAHSWLQCTWQHWK